MPVFTDLEMQVRPSGAAFARQAEHITLLDPDLAGLELQPRPIGPRAGPLRIDPTAQGVIAGANMILVDFHPKPEEALVDGPQALLLHELEPFLRDIEIARAGFLKRQALWAY